MDKNKKIIVTVLLVIACLIAIIPPVSYTHLRAHET